ncbi:NADH-ubiquinone oxidoreductase chain M [Enterobacter hormaechei]|nr:NADH-ubiquinone oxidoreductase chain M [Enterobacter hormaechei]
MLLPWLILIPFIGGFLCWQTERFGVKMPRWIALITMGLTLALGLQLWLQGGYSLTQSAGLPQWQSEFILPWIPRFGITIHLAIDGLSLLMVVLTGLLGVLAVLCSWREIEKYQGFFHLNLMWILGGVIGVFLAIDMFLFFFFWEMMLVPMYFLIALWGHKASDGKNAYHGGHQVLHLYPGEWSGDADCHPGAGVCALQRDRCLDLQLRRPAEDPDVSRRGIPADAGLLYRLRG